MKIYIPEQSNDSLLPDEPAVLLNKPKHTHQYDLDIVLDTELHTVGGRESIVITNNSEDDWQELYLRDYASAMYDGAKLTDFYVLTDGENDLDYQRDAAGPSIVRVHLKEKVMPGKTMTLVIEYQSYISEKSRNRLNYCEENTGELKYTLGNFYPVLSVYEDGQWVNHNFLDGHEPFYTELSNYHVSVTVPDDFTVCTSGQLVNVIEDRENHSKTYDCEAKNIRDFAMSASNVYEMVFDTVDGITVYSYYFKGEDVIGRAVLETSVQGLEFFNRYLGKYPYDTYTVAAVPRLPGGGMEYSCYVMIDGDYYQHYQESDLSDVHKGSERTVIHELAHQWFYGIVGNDQYDDAWLDESFASALTTIYFDYFDDHRFNSEIAALFHDVTKITRSAGDLGDDYLGVVYFDGQYFLLKVRSKMGEENFMKAMQEYVASYAFQIAQSENVLEIFQEHSPKSLKSLYRKFIEKEYY